jgi:hypothetical protein
MYDDLEDREAFYGIVRRAITRSAVVCHLDVLMGNHYHLFLEGAMEDVSDVMWQINYRYSLTYNARHKRINHLCGQRFHASPIADRRGARAVAVYIALNPVRAGFCDDPRAWPHGAFRAYAGIDEPRGHITMGFIRELFGSDAEFVQACDAARRAGRPGRPDLAEVLPEREAMTREHVMQMVKIFGYTREEIAGFFDVTPRSLNRGIAG